MSSTHYDKNASTPTGVPYRELPAPRDVTTLDAAGIVDAVTRQFDAGATAVVVHDHDGRTARITTPDDVTASDGMVAITSDDGETATVPASTITIVAGTDTSLAAIPLGSTVTLTYESQQQQYGTQERTGTVTDWIPGRSGSVYKLVLETDDDGRYEVWTNTGGVDKGSRWNQRKVGENATVNRHDEEDED